LIVYGIANVFPFQKLKLISTSVNQD